MNGNCTHWTIRALPIRNLFLFAVMLGQGLTNQVVSAQAPSTPKGDTATFQAIDTNRDQSVSLEEYLKLPGNPAELKRDFSLFDVDADGKLSRDEFSGQALPDPYDDLLEKAVESMDAAYDGWDKNPRFSVQSQMFARNFLMSLGFESNAAWQATEELVKVADTTPDHKITRDEARRFLEIQLGMRASNGKWLRGIENLTGTPEGAAAPAKRLAPIAQFRKADQNFDGLLDSVELLAATPEPQQWLVLLVMNAMDENGDKKLSLNEYLLSPLGNPVNNWDAPPTDSNRNRVLSFNEFRFKGDTTYLLRRLYFHRFDLNGDGDLSQEEFPFKLRPNDSLYYLSMDGKTCRLVFSDPEYPYCGSPSVSPDSRTVLFDGWKGGQTLSNGRVFRMNIDGSDVRDLCSGLMPNWSPDGKQLTCSRYEDDSGVWIMQADGTPVKKIDNGWSSQWSPEGNRIAYTRNRGIVVYDVETENKRDLALNGEQPFQFIGHNISWSPDGKRLSFRGHMPNGSQLLAVEVDGDQPKLDLYLDKTYTFENDATWAPTGNRIFVSMRSAELKRLRVHEITLGEAPKPVAGIPENLMTQDICLIPDGRGFIIKAREP